MENTQYSFLTTLKKGVKYFVIFLLPFLVDKFVVSYPELAQLSIGTLLVMLSNFLKVKVGMIIKSESFRKFM